MPTDLASIAYLANGAKSYPKERVECFYDGRTLVIDNWRELRRFNVRGPLFELGRRQDKGHRAEVEAWLAAVRRGGPSPIPLDELIEVSRWAIRAGNAARRQIRDRPLRNAMTPTMLLRGPRVALQSFGVTGIRLRAQHEMRRRFGLYLASPRVPHVQHDSTQSSSAFDVDLDRVRASVDESRR